MVTSHHLIVASLDVAERSVRGLGLQIDVHFFQENKYKNHQNGDLINRELGLPRRFRGLCSFLFLQLEGHKRLLT